MGGSSRPRSHGVGITPSPAPGTITEFVLPTAKSTPVDITAWPDGTLWFTELGGNRIGRITSRQ